MAQMISLSGRDWQVKGFIGEDWLWRGAHQPGRGGERGWVAAAVPGSIQDDLWHAGAVSNPYQGRNSLALEWVPQRTWLYRKTFRADGHLKGQAVALVFAGVDYAARYYLNGEMLGSSEGLFLPAAFEVGERLLWDADNLLVVAVSPAPFEQPQIGNTSRVTTQKPRMTYWWDFCPRMINIGIWDEVFLHASGALRVADVFARPVLAEDYQSAVVEVTVALGKPADLSDPGAGEVEVELFGPGGEGLGCQTAAVPAGEASAQVAFSIRQPELWWPNGAGGQPLYAVEARARVGGAISDTRRETFGLRTLALAANEGAAQGALPYNLVVNGRKLYINGWNWVPMDALYGVERTEKRERLLRLAQAAHVNLLRVWGGGLLEQRAFYDLCDRLGIVVWQEFTQSSSGIDNFPPEDPAYIAQLVRTAEQAVRQRRNHPSLGLWCGGNELHYTFDRLCDSSHPALAALKEVVERLDPGRVWVATSPAGGVFGFQAPDERVGAERLQDVHGPWEYQGLRAQYALYNAGRSLLHSEFGVEGLTNRRALDAIIPPEEQNPVSLDNPVWEHLGLWWVREGAWQEVFGPLSQVEAYQRATQFMQADGLRYAVEADRRRQFANGGTMPWQFNEPYPMASCTSAVDYFAEPKPVYYAVARAYRPLTVSARFETLAWGSEGQFSAGLWCSNSGAAGAGWLEAQVVGLSGRRYWTQTIPAQLPENGSAAVGEAALALEEIQEEVFFLDLGLSGAQGEPLARNRYTFSRAETLAPLLAAPRTTLEVALEQGPGDWTATLRNSGPTAALAVWLEAEKADLHAPGWAFFEDNYFSLLPGETRSVRVRWMDTADEQRGLHISGWNI